MGRIYSRAGGAPSSAPAIDVQNRERPNVRHSPHITREATVDRADGVRIEASPARLWSMSALDAPEPRAGFVQRWIDVDESTEGSAHYLKKMREGWAPREPASVAEAQRILFPSSKLKGGQDVIRVGRMVLCEMPIQIARQRFAAVLEMSDRQKKSVLKSKQELMKGAQGSDAVASFGMTETERVIRGGRKAASMVD